MTLYKACEVDERGGKVVERSPFSGEAVKVAKGAEPKSATLAGLSKWQLGLGAILPL
jgi:hypothetical protein